ncbi:MAG TPA: hypothetical protein VFX58_14530 [Chitinophagaceae bacterium]|nr:hypothetical protein [Chitinophagaceae bacterium]
MPGVLIKTGLKRQGWLAILFLVIVSSNPSLQAQKYYDLVRNFPANTPFNEVQQVVNNYYNTQPDKGRGSDYKHWKRYEWWASRHLNESGILENAPRRNAEVLASLNGAFIESTNASWAPVGPTSISNGLDDLGRVVCIAFHPTLANTFYIGTPAGGLWKTTDGGASYTPLSDNLPGLGVASIVIHPASPNTIFILTGDGNASHRGHYMKEHGTGLYKSTDGGITWQETGMSWAYSSITFGYKLMMHPNDPDMLMAATSEGFWRSFDAGSTWTQSASLAGIEITDFEFDPNSGARMYACGYSGNFYLSTDTGRTWSTVNIGAGSPDRMEIAVTPDATGYVYVVAGPAYESGGTFYYRGFYRSTNNGIAGSWSMLNNTPNILGYNNSGNDDVSQTWRNISLYISPTNFQSIIAGGCFIWKSSNGGSSFTKSSGSIHADNHFIVKHPLNSDLYSGCDGGLYRSTDGGTTWTNITTGLQITQYYRIAGTPKTFSLLLCGAQDNGQDRRSGTSAFTNVTGADGMDNAINSVDNDIMYACIQNGYMYKATDGLNFSDGIITQPTAGDDYWVTNVILHPQDPDTVYFGGSGGIRRSFNGGSTWTSIGSSGERYLAQGVSNSNRMYAASDLVSSGLTIQMSTNVNDASPTWTTISGGDVDYPAAASGKFITSMTVNPDNSLEMWFCLSGYFAGQKVYRTTNGGTDWDNMSGSLPNLPIHCIAFEDNDGAPGGAVYVGTEIGVFYRDNSMSDWRPFSNLLPNSPVTDLYIYKSGGTNLITASTFGRGLWRSSTYSECTADITVSGVLDGYRQFEASNSITSTNTVSGGVGTEIYMKAGNYVDLTEGFRAIASNGFFKAWIGNCGVGGIPNPNRLANNFILTQPDDLVLSPLSPVTGQREGMQRIVSGDHQLVFNVTGSVPVNIILEDANGERLAFLLRDKLPPGQYSLTLKKQESHAEELFLVTQINGERKKYKL